MAVLRRSPPSDVASRLFWSHVVIRPDGCWEWQGSRDKDGYGLTGLFDDRTRRAHRVAHEMQVGPIPEGHQVAHHCDNPPCVRGVHLFAATQAGNSADMVAKGRSLTGSRNPNVVHADRRPRGSRNGQSKLTEEQVAVIKARLTTGERLSSIAADHGVTHAAIWFIAKGIGWTHVQPGLPNGNAQSARSIDRR